MLKIAKITLAIIIGLIFITPLVNAATMQNCTGTNILNSTSIDYINDGTASHTIVSTRNETCPYGCELTINRTGRCIELEQSSLAIPIVWITGSILFGLFGIFLQNKELAVLRVVFFFVSIWMILNTINIVLNMAYLSPFASIAMLKSMATGIRVFNIVLFASFAIYFVMIVVNLLKMIVGLRDTKKNKFGKFK